jgi:hypothetical protein
LRQLSKTTGVKEIRRTGGLKKEKEFLSPELLFSLSPVFRGQRDV